jgi:eukaryotic-like serine/threonine-protein kinase
VDSRADPFGLVGQVLDGQFRVDRFVGEGGFSVVYQGTHVGLSEPIAVKCLKLPMALGSALVETFVKRFRDESRIHYKLSQGNLHIVRSIASGTTMSPATSALVPYAVLEWLDGRSLADEFATRRARGTTGRPLSEVVRLFDSAVDALAYAHSQGVVHRDLNPGNFFLAKTPSGTKLKVLDFGVAKVLADSTLAMGPSARTLGNVRMFAPAYGAPEQFDDRLGPISARTDVYALSLVLLEAMTDRGVIEGDHLGEFAAKALDEANRPSPRALGVAVGDAVQDVLARALALRPAERPGDAGELWGMLKHAMRSDQDSGRPAHAAPPASEPGPPPTLRMEQLTPAASPAIELGRAATLVAPPSAQPRALGGTLRIPHASVRSGAEALAATPFPVAMQPGPAPTNRSGTPLSPEPAASPAPQFPPISLPTPGFMGEVPAREASRARPAADPGGLAARGAPKRASLALLVVFSVLGALAIVAVLWLAMARLGGR